MQLRLEKSDKMGTLKDETGAVRGLWFPDATAGQDLLRVRALLATLSIHGHLINASDRTAASSGECPIQAAEDAGGYVMMFPSGPSSPKSALANNILNALLTTGLEEQRLSLFQRLFLAKKCAVCEKKILPATGYSLTAEEVVTSSQYWCQEFSTKRAGFSWPKMIHFSIELVDSSPFSNGPLRLRRLQALRSFFTALPFRERWKRSWLVCEICSTLFHFDRKTARELAAWRSPPGYAAVPVSTVATCALKTAIHSGFLNGIDEHMDDVIAWLAEDPTGQRIKDLCCNGPR